ncbi:YolD-like family protein [Brevibacillus brevis]|uniref:YolD-like family protein n=1 Tax=Brevibacillus brevis TaxID=1393 RepID=A0ABY9SWG9_BREBE|nr:YolD-like family protein [Brevibacillus brevis]WNC12170.1 YolD-like family protein [Brevibacillus brevis]
MTKNDEGRYDREGTVVQRPAVADDEFGEMCFRIYDSTQYNYPIQVKWFVRERGGDAWGTVQSARGYVREIDSEKYLVRLVDDDRSCWIQVEDIVSVTK